MNDISKEKLQDDEYNFPYHHLVELEPFTQSRDLFWGYKYAGYLRYVLRLLGDQQFRSIVDIGCGDGKVTSEIARRFPDVRVVGIDYSEKSLRFARAFSPQIEFATSTSETFDAFVLIEVIEHIAPRDMASFVSEIRKYVRTGSVGIITSPADNVPVQPKHYQHWNEETMRRALDPYFQITDFRYLSADTIGVQIIRRLLGNRIFILNIQPLRSLLFRIYERKYVSATSKNGTQVCAIVKAV